MTVTRRRRILAIVLVALVVASSIGIVVLKSRDPIGIRAVRANLAWNGDGTATLHETAVVRFGEAPPSGVGRDIHSVGLDGLVASAMPASAVEIERDGTGTSLRFEPLWRYGLGTPRARDYRLFLERPVAEVARAGRRVRVSELGGGFDRRVAQLDVEVVAPWRWEEATCGPSDGPECEVRIVAPGHVRIHVAEPSRAGVTFSARRGAPIAVTPTVAGVPRIEPFVASLADRLSLGGVMVVSALVCAALCAAWLRRVGGNWVMPVTEGATVADLAFDPPADGRVSPGAVRVDESRLADWATIAFEPPGELRPWQGGMILAGRVRPGVRIARALQRVADGTIRLDPSEPGSLRFIPGRRLSTTGDGRVRTVYAGSTSTATTTTLPLRFFVSDIELIEWFRGSKWSSWDDLARVVGAGAFGALSLVGAISATLIGFSYGPGRTIDLVEWAWFVTASMLGGVGLAALMFCWE
ncbi:MAG TPA: hypothetical protein VFN21_02385, partial [Acidimicrobiales bacterium]|nr:hypothetical protein [Acidimicrobiales bacterium]